LFVNMAKITILTEHCFFVCSNVVIFA
jgi:hypothetical protein